MPRRETLYSVHPAVTMVQKFIGGLPEKTGRSLAQWVSLVKRSPAPSVKERASWLQREHGFGPAHAMWIAERAEPAPRTNFSFDSEEDYLAEAAEYVATMYAGPKSHLCPIYERLLAAGRALGDDVRVCPCQTMVPLYRKHVFAQIKPTTRTRVDLGLCLRGVEFTDRLLDTGGTVKGDRITHRIPLTDVAEIDAEVLAWMRQAYEMAGS